MGLGHAPGQSVSYVVVDDATQSRERVLLASEELDEYDVGFYRELLVRAAASVLSPLGWRKSDIERELSSILSPVWRRTDKMYDPTGRFSREPVGLDLASTILLTSVMSITRVIDRVEFWWCVRNCVLCIPIVGSRQHPKCS